MNKHAVYHEAKSRWAYAADKDTLHIRLRTGRGDVKKVKVLATDPFNWFPDDKGGFSFDTESMFRLDMNHELSDDLFDYWFCEIRKNPTKRVRYCFILETDEGRYRFGAFGLDDKLEPDYKKLTSWFNFPFINEEDVFTPPKWVDETVWYQIFCDRFARVEQDGVDYPIWDYKESKDIKNSKMSLKEPLYKIACGGNLKGVIDKLPYIADLGFNGVYFTPIFEAISNHKYDTTDYFKIDPSFGTNDDFAKLIRKAHELGIRIMLDAVFNHCGFLHPFFQDVVKNGRDSEYYNYFHILKTPVLNFTPGDDKLPPRLSKKQMRELPYRTFAFTPHMPKWNTADPGAREYLLSVARFWVEKYDIDGWRIDVSNEVSHDFWREMCKQVKAIKPDIYLLGENWDDSYPWLNGGQFDGTMNYSLLRAAGDYISGRSDTANFISSMSREVFAAYPKPVQHVLFNLLDSHDTDRIITNCSGNTKAVILGYVILMTMAGCPSVFYGGEIGLDGTLDYGYTRRCMPWDDPVPLERDFRSFFKELIALRKKYPSFRSTEITFLKPEGGFLAYIKRAEDEELLVIINNSTEEIESVLPQGQFFDLLGSGKVTGKVSLPAYGFLLLLNKL
jgi:glycosidase